MIRPLPVRLFAAALAALLALMPFRQVMAGGGCAHHDGAAQGQASRNGSHAAHSAAATGTTGADPAPHSAPTPCTCIGHCQSGADVPLAVAPPPAIDRPSAEAAHGVFVDGAADGWILTFLPYGLAPPRYC